MRSFRKRRYVTAPPRSLLFQGILPFIFLKRYTDLLFAYFSLGPGFYRLPNRLVALPKRTRGEVTLHWRFYV